MLAMESKEDIEPEGVSRKVSGLPLLAGVFWGTAFPAIGLALEGFSPLAVAFWRAVIGTVSLGGWLLATGALTYRLAPGGWLRMGAIAMAGAGFFWAVQSVAVGLSTATNVAFLVAVYPAAVAVAAPPALGEKVKRANVVGLVLALAGAYLVISRGRILPLFTGESFNGDLLALAAAASFGTYIILGRLWQPVIGVTPGGLSFYTFALSLPVLGVATALTGPFAGESGPVAIGALLWLGLVASTGAFLALNYGMSRGAVAGSSVHLLAIPVVAAAVDWLLFRNTLTGAQWVGAALILLGIGATAVRLPGFLGGRSSRRRDVLDTAQESEGGKV